MAKVTIDRLGHLGDGIAAGPVYVPGTLPGEVVEGDVVDGVMHAPRILTPVSLRVAPPCRHAKACGGCQLQHASDGFVSDWKVSVVHDALAAHGITATIRPCITSNQGTRRRAGFSARRTKKGATAGFHRKKSDVIVEIPDCLLIDPALRVALPMVSDLALLGASRKAELTVQATVCKNGLDVFVTGGRMLDAPAQMQLADIARHYDVARVAWNDAPALVRRPPVVRFGKADVVPPPGAFLQATPEGESALAQAVSEATGPARTIADLFAGCGTFALRLAERAEVFAVEGDAEMVSALDHGWRNTEGLKRVTHATRDLFRNPLIAEELSVFEAVVIDPPRAGAEAQTAQIALAKVPRLAYVSCNPVTFARDTAQLVQAGYRLDWVQVVDQFRWSTHVELVAQLTFET